MKNVLIPISVRLNHFTDDTVTVGLLAFNESVRFYDFSYDKLGIAKSILDRNSGSYLENALKSMKAIFLEENNKNEIAFPNKILSEKYIDYLSKYSNGIVKIGEPKGFALDLNEESFLKAFKAFVGSVPGKISPHVPSSLRNEMRNLLKNEAFNKVDVLYNIKPSIISGIYASHKLDFIGINGSPYAGLAVDFTKDESEVDKTILTFRSIAIGLASKAKDHGMKSGKYDLYFNEPDSKENKKLLDMVRKDSAKGFELVDFSRMDLTIKKIRSGDYGKFSESKLAIV
jgi:hypothetical protein